MAPFSLPAPSIIPLRLPIFGGPKSIDTNTKIQLLCETYLDHEIFYTIDGTKPQPYAGIVQGSKVIKYSVPFCLPHGKIKIKAIAVNAHVHTMCSSVVTKCYEVLKAESESNNKQSTEVKRVKKPKCKKKSNSAENKENLSRKMDIHDEKKCDAEIDSFNFESVQQDDNILNCLDDAFVASEFDTEDSELEDSIEDDCSVKNVLSSNDDSLEESVVTKCDIVIENCSKDSFSEAVEETVIDEENMGDPNTALINDTAESGNTQFCCLKCDLTLQQCISCNKMNAVSSKYCIGCGKQLSQMCSFCSEYNSSFATFCQCCGKKLNLRSITTLEPLLQVDHSIMVKPESKNAAIQMLPVMIDKNTQTIDDKSPVRKSSAARRMPRHSPGRGYWHQQLDYICNNLKSHAYNNVDFRNEISEPMLCDFKSAHITKDECSIAVTVVFSPIKDKNGLVPEETKSKERESENEKSDF